MRVIRLGTISLYAAGYLTAYAICIWGLNKLDALIDG